jgi:hypothetical protein
MGNIEEEGRRGQRTCKNLKKFYNWASWCDDVNPSTLFRAWKKILSAFVEQHDSEGLEPKDDHWTCLWPGGILQWRISKCDWMVMTIQTTGVWLSRRLLILFWELPQIFKELYLALMIFCILHLPQSFPFVVWIPGSWVTHIPRPHIVRMSEGLPYCIHIHY